MTLTRKQRRILRRAQQARRSMVYKYKNPRIDDGRGPVMRFDVIYIDNFDVPSVQNMAIKVSVDDSALGRRGE